MLKNIFGLERVIRAGLRDWLTPLDDDALDLLFGQTRTHNGWHDCPVADDLLRQAVEIAKMGPYQRQLLAHVGF